MLLPRRAAAAVVKGRASASAFELHRRFQSHPVRSVREAHRTLPFSIPTLHAAAKHLVGLGIAICRLLTTPNHPGHWRWTRKVKTKTITIGLFEEQAALFKVAIADHCRLEALLLEMHAISQDVLLNPVPGVPKKTLTQKASKLGTILV